MSLPVMGSWEAARQLKANPDTKDIPVPGLSAHAMTSDRDRAVVADCDDCDTEPADIERLLGKIRDLLGASDGG